ncbi:hypothetical protein O2K51_10905 [Apibacter raozihei]|uniref:T9SS type A sorting domain-containing protein n=1 Tax=Apibacter raozihei TaxID=2500547 RepID=UPI000FE3B13E|nr:T9SS type A sorting domain-containing protein [Apibacter raozihei]
MKKSYSALLLFLFVFTFSQSEKLVFDYDISGNQVLRKYQLENQKKFREESSLDALDKSSEKRILIYPNPVETGLFIEWDSSIANLLTKIELVPYNGNAVEEVKFIASERRIWINMAYRLPGVYYFKIYCSNGEVLLHSVIKN